LLSVFFIKRIILLSTGPCTLSKYWDLCPFIQFEAPPGGSISKLLISFLLNFLGRAAAAKPAPKQAPISAQVQTPVPEPIVQAAQDEPSTSSKGKLINTFLSSII
jgi:hypothetical protein